MSDTRLCDLDATGLSTLIRARDVSPVDVVQAHLDRIDALDPNLRAYVHVCADEALAAAQAAEREIASGRYRGALHGVPVAHKDIFHVRGLPTAAGSRTMRGFVADEDATVVARLRREGAICLGKLNTTEFAAGSMEVFGEARNPWNLNATTGGSSAGAGGALAAGLVALATGSDTGGSTRIPASFCGVVGLKPTYGRVSRHGMVPLSWSLDHPGALARSVRDVALLLRAIAGPDPRDPTAASIAVPHYAALLSNDLRGIRIGVARGFFADDVDAEVRSAVRVAVESMRGLGATLSECDLPHSRFALFASWAINYSEAFTLHRAGFLAHPGQYTSAFLRRVTVGACLTAEERVLAQRARQLITAELVRALENVDAIVTPTTPFVAYAIDGAWDGGDRARLTRSANLAGLPALSVPCGFTRGGLPIGLQIIGRAWDEGDVLRVGHAYLESSGWMQMPPPLTAAPIGPDPAKTSHAAPGAVDAAWVKAIARVHGLDFVRDEDAEPVAALVGKAKTELEALRSLLDASIESPVRAAPGPPSA
jgi:aspartyl-tRNA(Asn)/glutamyl-tRNA(Gln) amidotransferase subunit A